MHTKFDQVMWVIFQVETTFKKGNTFLIKWILNTKCLVK